MTETEAVPQRVVSLVPSVTESLFVLGLGESLVGITEYCVQPKDRVASLPKVGGTKDPDTDTILALRPDLVIANQEENTPRAVETLQSAGVRVLVQFPCTVDQALEGMYELAALFRNQNAMLGVESLARAVDYARAAGETSPRVRYFCPIWYAQGAPEGEWWMVFNHETYAGDLLGMLGGENVFADRQRRYPLSADLGQADPQDPEGRDTRYPRVGAAEVRAADPDLILLPSEPYGFGEDHAGQLESALAGTKAVESGRIRQVDGSLLTWHGVRLAQALQVLPGVLQG